MRTATTVIACVACFAVSSTVAASEPTLVSTRFTGLFADHELDFLPGNGIGSVLTVAGMEVGVATPAGLVVEGGAEWLLALSSHGWAGVVRGGWRLPVFGKLGIERNRWLGTLIPLLGVRFGSHPYSSTTDSYALSTNSVGAQLGLAHEIGRVGPKVGYLVRIFAAGNARFVNEKRPAEGIAWDYAASEPATFTLEAGVSFGFTIPVL
jgi:hypothetical protein